MAGRTWAGDRGARGLCWAAKRALRAGGGRDVKPYITAMEKFSSMGGMLPEQVWDHDDIPQEGMYWGKSAGSAQPLVWAHSEYIKLLRSVVDGKVFDCISVVKSAMRCRREADLQEARGDLQTSRPVRRSRRDDAADRGRSASASVYAGQLGDDARWSSQPVGYRGVVVDIATQPGQTGKILFTFYWPGQDKWLGRNFEVIVVNAGS
jgi:glucoamylase